MRHSDLFLASTALLLVLTAASFVNAGLGVERHQPRLEAEAELVERLGLTDLVLFTEARYTRHPSQADLHSAFQDHPFAMDHFPSGSLMGPPRRKDRP